MQTGMLKVVDLGTPSEMEDTVAAHPYCCQPHAQTASTSIPVIEAEHKSKSEVAITVIVNEPANTTVTWGVEGNLMT